MLGPVLSIQSFSRALDAPNPHYAVGDYHKESYTLNLQLLLLVLGVVGAGVSISAQYFPLVSVQYFPLFQFSESDFFAV